MIKQQKLTYFLTILFCLLFTSLSYAESSIQNIKVQTTNLGSEINIYLSGDNLKKPKIFTTDNPATISIDFLKTRLGLKNKQISVGEKGIKNIFAVETETKSRVIINLDNLVPYEYKENKNEVTLVIPGPVETKKVVNNGSNSSFIKKIDFEATDDGPGTIVIDFSSS